MDVMEARGEVTEEQQRAVKRGSKVKMSPMRSEESNEESTQSMRTRSKGPRIKDAECTEVRRTASLSNRGSPALYYLCVECSDEIKT